MGHKASKYHQLYPAASGGQYIEFSPLVKMCYRLLESSDFLPFALHVSKPFMYFLYLVAVCLAFDYPRKIHVINATY